MKRGLIACLLLVRSGLPIVAQVSVEPVRVSGGVMEELLVHKVAPVFPPEPGVNVQGPVVLRAVIDKEGNVESLQLVSGHPLLVPAATDAVKQWKYRPYLLNGIPVKVETTIGVGFLRLSQAADESASAARSSEAVVPSLESEKRIEVPPGAAGTLLLRKVAPVYPPLARQARIQGTVILSIVIDKGGEVRDTKLVSGHPMLAPAGIEAVKQWRYKPYISDEQADEVDTIVRVTFKLADSPAESGSAAENHGAPPRVGVPQLVRVSAGVMQGLLASKVDPEYPADAKAQHIEGTVVLNVNIDKEGNVARVELVSGHPMLAPAVMDAVLQWRYRPFLLNGEAVAVETTVQVKFALKE